jgi:FADH2 O2-dependent halogenase
MSPRRFDIVILGAGFAGSLMSMIARRLGHRVAMIDRSSHPRFAIGESSTPVANFVLRDLALRYDLPRLLPLCKFGPWQRHYPELGCGLKRGFTYFQHQPGRPFRGDSSHSNELSVAASRDNEQSDTHWLRADLDAFLADEAQRLDVAYFDRTELTEVRRSTPWVIEGRRRDQTLQFHADFVIDATGEGAVLPRALKIPSASDELFTHSRALFSHFHGIQRFERILERSGGVLSDHPFPCDDAAQHQVLDHAWIWVLRFQQDLTSVGFAIDMERDPDGASQPDSSSNSTTPEMEWQQWVDRFPGIAELIRGSRLADVPGRYLRTGRLQRKWRQCAGSDFAFLPHTAGFIDPLHSSGIAHSLCGIERLAAILDEHWRRPTLELELLRYQSSLHAEISVIDRLVHGCYLTTGHFRLFAAFAMLYFAAATTYERRRIAAGFATNRWFLGAEDRQWCGILAKVHGWLLDWRARGRPDWNEFPEMVARELAPYNHVGLFDGRAKNMYRYTAPPDVETTGVPQCRPGSSLH